MYPYRVFISYAHSDRDTVERLVEAVNNAGLVPLWDNDLLPGTGFSEQIQRFIINSHMFLPFITAASANRPWIHQEIGFAKALGKPIIPVTLGSVPPGIISDIQAIQLKSDLTDMRDKLSADFFARIIDSMPDLSATYECTEDKVRHALLLARYADNIWAIRKHGMVRQMASLTSFHVPDRGSADPVWKKVYPATPDDRFLFDAVRRERIALLRHAREGGCRLILDPIERLESVYHKYGASSVQVRIEGLLQFLRDDSVTQVIVAINDDTTRTSSITLVGDWFSSEAVSTGGTRILREALFTRDVTTIRQQIEDFDNRMRDLLAIRGWNEQTSRTQAVAYLQTFLNGLPDQ